MVYQVVKIKWRFPDIIDCCLGYNRGVSTVYTMSYMRYSRAPQTHVVIPSFLPLRDTPVQGGSLGEDLLAMASTDQPVRYWDSDPSTELLGLEWVLLYLCVERIEILHSTGYTSGVFDLYETRFCFLLPTL